jgi:hypothetical protein
MSHFAKVENGVVTAVIVATQAEINTENHGDAFLWVQTSYNRNFRGAYAGIGGMYDKERDVFFPAQPYSAWLLDETTWSWIPPIEPPTIDHLVESYIWDEDTDCWVVTKKVLGQ